MGEPLSSEALFLIVERLFLALLVVSLLALVAVVARRFLLERGGAVECYLRRAVGPHRAWRIGCGRYGSDELSWYRIFSLWPRPAAELPRRGLVVMGRRSPTPEDLAELTGDLVVIEVGWAEPDGSDPKEPVYELAMGEGALTGFLSWLESMPPGTIWQS
ncbi:DUF2550 domain-containing protein [Marinactinospora thermotolerans]|uniref:DUF2550 domain-containing protein n=1 Tax=Marinactinospora thermotolerans DSM 45154 TaxID=1122192 RepID=A0A1T4QA00_9ACTN|nr:DUF2550 domain-containing protein [Marinactinospora thermotolerans]SKA00038.1 Protein of unknown function [Marinactinospora thermotolerans DSM 45154]